MKLQVASQDGSVLVVTTPGARLGSPTPGLGANVVQWPLVAPSGLRLTSDQGTPAHEYVRAYVLLRHTVTHGETRPLLPQIFRIL